MAYNIYYVKLNYTKKRELSEDSLFFVMVNNSLKCFLTLLIRFYECPHVSILIICI